MRQLLQEEGHKHLTMGTKRGMEKGFHDPQDESAPVIN